MEVGDLVRARHWYNNEIAIVVSIRNERICSLAMGDYVFDQSIRDLEVLSEAR